MNDRLIPYTHSEDSPLPVEAEMLEALEYFHCAQRYRNTLVACILGHHSFLEPILGDLKLLRSANIEALVFARSSIDWQGEISRLNSHGYSFQLVMGDSFTVDPRGFCDKVGEILANAAIPLVLFEEEEGEALPPSQMHSRVVEISRYFGVYKLFFFSRLPGLEVEGALLSHPSHEELRDLLTNPPSMNIPLESMRFLEKVWSSTEIDCVILPARCGALFQEVFTHRGCGTLLSSSYVNTIRGARLRDSREIALLMKPALRSGLVLPVTEDQIAAAIDDFCVYTVNDQIVAVARLIDYGEAFELGKLVTLPRYRGRGRARQLVKHVIDKARERDKKSLFALTIDPDVENLFQSLGFEEVLRSSLPEAWKTNYDFRRPSRAYQLGLASVCPR